MAAVVNAATSSGGGSGGADMAACGRVEAKKMGLDASARYITYAGYSIRRRRRGLLLEIPCTDIGPESEIIDDNVPRTRPYRRNSQPFVRLLRKTDN